MQRAHSRGSDVADLELQLRWIDAGRIDLRVGIELGQPSADKLDRHIERPGEPRRRMDVEHRRLEAHRHIWMHCGNALGPEAIGRAIPHPVDKVRRGFVVRVDARDGLPVLILERSKRSPFMDDKPVRRGGRAGAQDQRPANAQQCLHGFFHYKQILPVPNIIRGSRLSIRARGVEVIGVQVMNSRHSVSIRSSPWIERHSVEKLAPMRWDRVCGRLHNQGH